MKRCLWILFVACAMAGASAGEGKQASERSAADWQAMARGDLDLVHATIVSSHPGVIDTSNPGFNDWVESGYRQALALVPQAISYDTAMSVVRFYTTGFLDGHLGYSDDVRSNQPVIHDGWSVDFVKGRYVVAAVLPDWPVAQPPLGAELVACDGRSPDDIIRQDVAPFVDRRDDPTTRHAHAQEIGALHVSNRRLRHCHFRSADGSMRDLRVVYRPVSTKAFFSTLVHVADASQRRGNGFTFQDGVLWIRAANFNLRSGTPDATGLEAMLEALPGLAGVKTIVFDTRGNMGGDSTVGDRIFDAATGGLDYDRAGIERLPHVYAQWRVSGTLLATATQDAARKASLYGESSAQVLASKRFLDQVKAALAAGETWIEQDGDYRITRADIVARHGRLRRFDGTVMLLTDAHCVSACLDFADVVRQVPGAIHLGQTTGSDTVYLEGGSVRLPSGNHLMLPLKVWRNRLRGNSEPLTPDIPLDVDMDDDAAVRKAVLAAQPSR